MFQTIAMKLVAKLLTAAFIEKLVIFLLEKLAQRTDNTIDDEIVKLVKEALDS